MAQPPMPDAVPGTEPQGKPRRFSFIVIVAIVLTSIGILTSFGAALTSLFSDRMMSGPFSPTPPPGAPPELARAMSDMQEKLSAVAMPWLTGSLAVLQLAACTWGLFAALALQKRKANSVRPFVLSMTALGLLEIVAVCAGLYIQLRTVTIMQELVEAFAVPARPGGPDIATMMRTIMTASIIGGIVIAIGWGALKVVFFFYARYYAGKPEVRAWLLPA